MIPLLLSCEHGGNRLPPRYAALFDKGREALRGHRGWDSGALDLARRLAKHLHAPLVFATVTRLLVELNRSPRHPALFSEFSRGLSATERERLMARYYRPYRERLAALVAQAIEREGSAVHLSVHTFAPVLGGLERTADVGLLYDPRRASERALCDAWLRELRALRPDLRVRRNYPYLGRADGLTTHLRKQWPQERYAGIELEVNQRWPLARGPEWPRLKEDLAATLERSLREISEPRA